jgi:uncharacterized protein (DUF779 family)
VERVKATPAAVEMVERLRAKHGSIVFHQSGGCCEGSATMCLMEAELPAGPNDIQIGAIAGARFLVDRDLYERWGEPDFLIDLAPQPADGFSLEGAERVRFVSRTPGD